MDKREYEHEFLPELHRTMQAFSERVTDQRVSAVARGLSDIPLAKALGACKRYLMEGERIPTVRALRGMAEGHVEKFKRSQGPDDRVPLPPGKRLRVKVSGVERACAESRIVWEEPPDVEFNGQWLLKPSSRANWGKKARETTIGAEVNRVLEKVGAQHCFGARVEKDRVCVVVLGPYGGYAARGVGFVEWNDRDEFGGVLLYQVPEFVGLPQGIHTMDPLAYEEMS